VLGSGGTGISGSSDIVATIQWEIQNSAVSTQVAVAHDPKDPQPVNHAILTFQPTPSIPLLAITERLVGNLVGPTKKGTGVFGHCLD